MCPGATDTPVATGILACYEKLNVDPKRVLLNLQIQQ
jgi:hypothetical protein